jgi:hypothetical protein
MRPFVPLLAAVLSSTAMAEPVHLDVGDTHVIVVRPADLWDPNKKTVDGPLQSLRSKKFGYRYIDAAGATITPDPKPLLPWNKKVVTPLSDEVTKLSSAKGFQSGANMMYFIDRAFRIDPPQMATFTATQNSLYKAWASKQGDPTTLTDRLQTRDNVNLLATLAIAAVGVNKFGADRVDVTNYFSLYPDIAKLTGGMDKLVPALIPVPLPDYDFSGFTQVDVRKVRDNYGHVGEIVIGYRQPKTAEQELAALAQAIATTAGVDTTEEAIAAARSKNYETRLTIWEECKAKPGCAGQ